MPNVSKPQSYEIIPDNFMLGACIEDSKAEKGHEQVEVSELQGDDEVVAAERFNCSADDLLGNDLKALARYLQG
jgi:hypothetical protein